MTHETFVLENSDDHLLNVNDLEEGCDNSQLHLSRGWPRALAGILTNSKRLCVVLLCATEILVQIFPIPKLVHADCQSLHHLQAIQ